MAETKINWSTAETWQRVVAAIVASGVKIDMNAAAAKLGVSYYSFEGGLRKIKAEVAEMKGKPTEATTPKKKKSLASPTKSSPTKSVLHGTQSGRITKPSPGKRTKTAIKSEQSNDGGGDLHSDDSVNDANASNAGIYEDEV